MKDISIKVYFSTIVGSATLQVSNVTAKDNHQSIVTLYVRVRSFSYAEDGVGRFKCKVQKQTEVSS